LTDHGNRIFENIPVRGKVHELELDFCKMDIGPIFLKKILFFDILEEST